MLIAVWGNSGAGKSTVAIKLANSFARKNKNVVLVDAGFVAPQMQVWFPRMEVKSESSIRVILDNAVTVETVAAKLSMVRGRSNYGVLGYAKGFALNQVTDRRDTTDELLGVLSGMADVVIVDCQYSVMDDILTFRALETADERLVVLSPDLRGISWYDSNVKPMLDAWDNHNMSTNRVLNGVTRKTPAEQVESSVGSCMAYLPFTLEIRDELYSGTLSEDGIYSKAKNYASVIEGISKFYYDKYKLGEAKEITPGVGV